MKIVIDSRKRSVGFTETESYVNAMPIDIYLEIDGAVQTSFVDFNFKLLIKQKEVDVFLYDTSTIGEIVKMSKNPFVSLLAENLLENTEYLIEIFVTDQDGNFDGKYQSITVIRPAPFESWTYDIDSNTWIAPKEKPLDDKPYIWNDFTKDWEVAILPIK